MNTLDILLKSYNWQGGTIHQAIEHFSTLDKNQQDSVCNVLMDNLNKITDIENVQKLLKIRNNYLIYNKV